MQVYTCMSMGTSIKAQGDFGELVLPSTLLRHRHFVYYTAHFRQAGLRASGWFSRYICPRSAEVTDVHTWLFMCPGEQTTTVKSVWPALCPAEVPFFFFWGRISHQLTRLAGGALGILSLSYQEHVTIMEVWTPASHLLGTLDQLSHLSSPSMS